MRFGGTPRMSPDSVDRALEYYAIQTSFGGDGQSLSSSLNTLKQNLPVALDLWGAMLRDPAFDSAEVDTWRGRELEAVRRLADDPGRLAVAEFNHLMYGDHPIGWEMQAADLAPQRVSPTTLSGLHRLIVCPGNLVLGVTGDVSWKEIEPALTRLLRSWAPCSAPLPPSPIPRIRREPGVFLIPRKLEQSVIVMAQPTGVRMGADRDYFAAKVGDQILGGAGFQSRLMSRLRTEEGYAYSASSLWTTPRRFDGILGAITRTRPETTVSAAQLILQVMTEMREHPPRPDELTTVVEQFSNGFAFNFENPATIVSRRMFYLAEDLPADWLERYLRGMRSVTAAEVGAVFRDNLHPERMTILIVGDPDAIGSEALEKLGHVTIWDPDHPPAGGERGRH
jgi:predicted Zn-dependent peptidase